MTLTLSTSWFVRAQWGEEERAVLGTGNGIAVVLAGVDDPRITSLQWN